MDVRRHRINLSAQDQGECRRLDSRLPDLEAFAQQAGGTSKAQADVDLYMARKRYFDLKC